jgi:hypothetical protein
MRRLYGAASEHLNPPRSDSMRSPVAPAMQPSDDGCRASREQLCLLGTCTNIGGATGATLTLLGIDVGDTLDASVTATNVTGSSSATSKPTEKLLGIL